MSTTDNFFTQQQEKSKVKTLIVTEFFKAYFPIINNSVGKNSQEIFYLDLFCGPGKYDDGSQSTPLELLDLVNNFKGDDIRNKLKIVFNDENEKFTSILSENMQNHQVLERLKHKPTISNKRVGEIDLKLFTYKKEPIFSFVDPWGYKDVSAQLVWELVKNIGSDCVLFFNSNRCLMDIPKRSQNGHFEQIFGKQFSNAEKIVLSSTISQKKKAQKIVELFSKNMYDAMIEENYPGYKLYVLPFEFEADDKEKISHHIVFITKNHKAIIEMKKVMIRHNNSNGTQLCFDSKDRLQVSFFNRTDFSEKSIRELICKCFSKNTHYFEIIWTVSTLLEAIDTCNMESEFQVTPYTSDELKNTLEKMSAEGYVTPLDTGKKMRKSITDTREFKINLKLLE